MDKNKAYILALCSTALGGINSITFKLLFSRWECVHVAFVEAMFLTLIFIFAARSHFRAYQLKEWLYLIVGGMLNGAAFLCFYLSLSYLHPVDFSFLSRNQAAFAILLGILFLGERPSFRESMQMVCALAGALLLSYSPTAMQNWTGILFAMIFCLSISLRAYLIKIGPDFNSGELMLFGSIGNLLVSAILIFFQGTLEGVTALLSTSDVLIICCSSLFANAIGISLYLKALQSGNLSLVSSIRSLSPLFVLFYSSFFFEYEWSSTKLLGLTLSLFALILLFPIDTFFHSTKLGKRFS